jgi:hypothetical protein
MAPTPLIFWEVKMTTIRKFVKKSSGVIVEAAKLTEDNVDELSEWSQSFVVEEKNALNHSEVHKALNVKTDRGMKRCSQGMYLVKFRSYQFVVHASRFEGLYTPLEVEERKEEPDRIDRRSNQYFERIEGGMI